MNPCAELAAKQREVDLLVGADPALERDRGDDAARLEHVDPGVVVVDDLARLLDDRPADLLDAARPAQAGRGGLEHAQLGGSLFVWAIRSEFSRAIAACVPRAVTNATSLCCQLRGSSVIPAREPMTLPWWNERDDDVAADLEDTGVTVVCIAHLGPPGIVDDPWRARPDDLAEPALALTEDGQAGRGCVVHAGPCDHLEPLVAGPA